MSHLKRPIAELVNDIKVGKLSAEQLVLESLEAIKKHDDYHAILELNSSAIDQAKALDKAIAGGKSDGDLLGIPYIAKDNFLTVGTHTTAASHILEPFEAPFESSATRMLAEAGAIMVAKANLDAFAHGSSTENSDFGPTKNPVDPAYVPGGSSGGSAAAVALGLASFALGTDTGGSIRQPASYCGVVGLKPTYGLVSRYGVVAMASSTDVIGPLTRSVADAARVLNVLAGKDPMDGTTIERDAQYSVSPVNKLRVGVVKDYMHDELDPEVRQRVESAIEVLRQNGAQVDQVSLPEVNLALPTYYILVPAEISSNLSRYDGIKYGYYDKSAKSLNERYLQSREQGFGAEAKRRILVGTYVLSSGYYDAYYKRAQKVRSKLINGFNKAFEDYDILIGPSTPGTAFKLGEKVNDPLSMYLEDIMTVAANLVGIPGISVPAGTINGLPIGVQLLAAQGDENVLLSAASIVEASS